MNWDDSRQDSAPSRQRRLFAADQAAGGVASRSGRRPPEAEGLAGADEAMHHAVQILHPRFVETFRRQPLQRLLDLCDFFRQLRGVAGADGFQIGLQVSRISHGSASREPAPCRQRHGLDVRRVCHRQNGRQLFGHVRSTAVHEDTC